MARSLVPGFARSRSRSMGLVLARVLSAAADLVVTLWRLGAELLSCTALVIRSRLLFITCCSFCCHFLLADCSASSRSCSSDRSSSSAACNGRRYHSNHLEE